MQQAVDMAVSVGRKVTVVGRSMRKNVNIARNLGYMDVPDDVLLRPPELEELTEEEVTEIPAAPPPPEEEESEW